MCGFKRASLILVSGLVFALHVWAGDGLLVELGFGRVKIKSQGASASQTLLEEVETQILIDEEFAGLVTRSQAVSLEIAADSLPKEITKESVLNTVRERLRIAEADRKREALGSEDDDPSGALHAGRSKWVLGGKFSVGKDEAYDDLYVLGGDVEISGRVKELYVLGGQVHLRSPSHIQDGLWVLGGRVETETGARHPTIQSESDWEWHWPGSHFEFEEKELLSWLWLSFLIVWLLMTGFFFFVGQTFSPDFQGRVQMRMKQSFLGSVILGMAFCLSVPMLLGALVVSLVGILFIPFVLSLLTLILFFGYAHLAQWLVTEVFRSYRERPILAGAIGLFGLFVVSLIAPSFFVIVTLLSFAAAGAYLATLAQTFFSRAPLSAPKV